MTHEMPPPLDPDVRALLTTERAISDDDVSDETKQRLRRRLQASLGAAVVGTGVALGANAAKGTAIGSIAGGGWIAVFGAFVLGAIAGAGAHAYAHRHDAPSPPIVTTVFVEKTVEGPVAAPAVSATSTTSVQAPAPPPPELAASVTSKQPSAQPSVSSTAGASTSDTTLAAERSLLEIARTALARGDSASALDALGRHQAQFPKGQLSEEREALYVQALSMAGRSAEAKQRADRFRKTWPGSMLLPVVEAAVE
jgi:hypothetical protein